ncbi:hypothetical protein Kpol_325p9 [Vanderwaltozyma polyspora DSM 70294]|uniref:Protein ZRG17 n=1 Tax=Vanderwaltozyma polyspora (strain ATCC 22028 / DSM 70294 / BCRC 21397 / CBS 2163 / NBRC 10782 / NRRL Y-8283 / UCD 57-17) TaxID=436907 RepID=A7TSU2_VANPO|nr:uncharacterized protein Kpol_325p9 [Vanderwaltozyma polyspora DSM 70294]EDO14670.1 hypothetical protein Kpol_325p9 [Vanderwaltozyma polyspora DSM 70294]
METPTDSRFHSSVSTPVMNSIKEEDSPTSPKVDMDSFFQGNHAGPESPFNTTSSPKSNNLNNQQSKPLINSPFSRPNSSFYSSQDGNNSSSSIIYNPSFSFGGSGGSGGADTSVSSNNTGVNSPVIQEGRRASLKYVPTIQLAPPPLRSKSPKRSKSPRRSTSPLRSMSPENRKKRLSIIGSDSKTSPFNFNSSSLKPQQGSAGNANSRASFRKGHRYKHSSVSMNFFQEPEVKVPLNIAKALPIPDFRDFLSNLPWPKAYYHLGIMASELVMCITVFALGHTKSWSNFITLSHFIVYDIIGSLAILFAENLSQFEVWSTGTITFPFGLNRIDVLLSFGLAISLCFVGLDLLFHIIEELIVLFVEFSNSTDNHDELATHIPHSHGSNIQLGSENGLKLWYSTLLLNLLFSSLALYKIYYANTNSKLKTKNPIVTIAYTVYLFFYPLLVNRYANIADYVSACLFAGLIIIHGLTIVEWTSTILLMGFSTTSLPSLTLLDMDELEQPKREIDSKFKRQVSLTDLPQTISNNVTSSSSSSKISEKSSTSNNPTIIKSLLKERIESLSEFKSRCHLDYNNLLISKVNFQTYIVLMKISLKGGSNNEELALRLAIDKCINQVLPSAEATIDIDIV